MNANNMKTQPFHSIKYDIKGHCRSHVANFGQKLNFLDIFLFKTYLS